MFTFVSSLLLVLSLLRVSSTPLERRTTCTWSQFGYTATGLLVNDACRYTVRYGQAERWGESTMPLTFDNNSFAALPPSCPQDQGVTASSIQSEGCLFLTAYIPQGTAPTTGWPVFVWIHGGSFTAGSASAPGLDGSILASKGNMIVIILQYRLGVLGLIPPSLASTSADPNLAMKDVILALKLINQGIPYVGGDNGMITVGGESSGASMIRALWGAPSAAGLFRAAILQSDPMSYGFATTAITTTLQESFYAQEPFSSCSTLDCLQAINVSQIIKAQDTLYSQASYIVTGAPYVEPIRPTYGVASLPSDPTTLLFSNPDELIYTPSSLPLLITTVKNEGGSATESLFASPVPLTSDTNTTYYSVAAALIDSSRASTLVNSVDYALPTSASGTSTNTSTTAVVVDDDIFRETFERAVTDGIWRCPNRDAASKWAAAGGNVWVGEWRQGVTYPDNQIIGGYCATDGRVCHEDDIYSTFSSAPDPTSNSTTFESSILSYWSSFITNLNPNPSSKRDCSASGYPTRRAASSSWPMYESQEDVYPLGGDGEVSTCPEGVWGTNIEYDWQLYG